MGTKWFPAALAAVLFWPALAAAQAVPPPPAPGLPQAPAAPDVTIMGMVVAPDRSDRPVITKVVSGSPAARAGLHENDVIEGIGHQATPTIREFLNLTIPLIQNLDPGTKLTWRIDRYGQDIKVSMPRPTDRELGPLSAAAQQVLAREAGSLGYYSSAAPSPPPRPYPERPHVGHDVYADAQYSWWYDGDDIPPLVGRWLAKTVGSKMAPNRDFQFYWWYDGDPDLPQRLTQWIDRAGTAQEYALNPDLQYNWWHDGD